MQLFNALCGFQVFLIFFFLLFLFWHDFKVTHSELLLTHVRSSGLDIFLLLISSDKLLPDELSSRSIKVTHFPSSFFTDQSFTLEIEYNVY